MSIRGINVYFHANALRFPKRYILFLGSIFQEDDCFNGKSAASTKDRQIGYASTGSSNNLLSKTMTVQNENETRPSSKLEFADKAESLVSGIVHFASSFLLTVWHLGFRQTRFVQRYISDSRVYLKPLTMLILLAFLATKTARILAVSILFGISSALRGCGGETMLDVEEPEILRNPLTLPSVDEVVFVSIPLFLAVTFIAYALRWALFGSANGVHGQSKEFTFYAVSFSLACCTIAASFPVIVVAYPDLEQHIPTLPDAFNEFILVLLVLLWPALVYYRLIACSSLFPMLRPRLTFAKRLLLAVAALVLACTTILIAMAVTYPYVVRDLKPLDEKKPVLGARLISQTPHGFVLLLSNNSNDDLWILSERIRFAGTSKPGLFVQRDPAESNLPVFLLQARSAIPLLLTSRPRSEEEMTTVSVVTPREAIAFDTLTHSGKRQTIYSLIRDDNGPVSDERLGPLP